MKNNKRTLALLTAGLLAVTPMAATGLTAFAADDNSITITVKKEGTHNYKAYQIFKGTLQGTGTDADPYVLLAIDWGDNVTGADFLIALKADDAFLIDDDNDASTPKVNAFAGANNAEQVAGILEQYADNSDFAIAFAKFAGNHLKTGVNPKASDNEPNTSKKYELTGLAAGYYLVKDEADITQDTPRTLNMLKVAGQVTLTTKEDLPTLDKKIITSTTPLTKDDKNEASIGDVIDYELTSVVPTMEGYDKYFYVINDKMADGLTFDPSSVKVYINGAQLVNDATNVYYRVDQDDNAKVGNVQYTFQIVMNDFIQHKAQAGKEIKVTYSAKLNENANITNTGNPNKVFLTYSNNPNVEATPESAGNPDEPKPGTPPNPDTPDNPGDDYDSPVGVTPWSDVNTFTTAIKIIKVDDSASPQKLKGAEFKLTGTDMNIVLVSEDQFILDNTNGTYWELTDGTYTTTAPSTSGVDTTKYVDTSKKYKRTTIFTQKGNIATPVDVKGFVDDDGWIIFKGLGAGEYTLTETTTPKGYNTVSPITIIISNDKVANAFSKTNPNWKVVKDADPDVELTASDYIYGLQVVNVKGSTLPSTGGMGTRLFYIIGGLLVAGSLVLLVTKKRMSKEN